jgi:hypothetical protein
MNTVSGGKPEDGPPAARYEFTVLTWQ